jgi:hypothetical protein
MCDRWEALFTARRTSEWRRRFSSFLGPHVQRRGDRLEAIVLVGKILFARTDLVNRNVYVAGPESARGLPIRQICELGRISVDRVNDALADLKSAGVEFFHPSRSGKKRMPSSQPRRQGSRLPDDPYEPGEPFWSEPAIRCIDLDQVAGMLGLTFAMKLARDKAAKKRKQRLATGAPVPRRRRRRGYRSRAERLRRQRGPAAPAAAVSLLLPTLNRLSDRAAGWTPEPPPPPPPIAKPPWATDLEVAMISIASEYQRRTGLLLDDEAVEAEARRRLGLPQRKTE